VLQPAFEAGSWRSALLYGGLFGFFAYATYDMTNRDAARLAALGRALRHGAGNGAHRTAATIAYA